MYRSNYIIDNTAAYYNNLRKVTEESNREDWIIYILDMVKETALKGRKQIIAIEALMNTMAFVKVISVCYFLVGFLLGTLLKQKN